MTLSYTFLTILLHCFHFGNAQAMSINSGDSVYHDNHCWRKPYHSVDWSHFTFITSTTSGLSSSFTLQSLSLYPGQKLSLTFNYPRITYRLGKTQITVPQLPKSFMSGSGRDMQLHVMWVLLVSPTPWEPQHCRIVSWVLFFLGLCHSLPVLLPAHCLHMYMDAHRTEFCSHWTSLLPGSRAMSSSIHLLLEMAHTLFSKVSCPWMS